MTGRLYEKEGAKYTMHLTFDKRVGRHLGWKDEWTLSCFTLEERARRTNVISDESTQPIPAMMAHTSIMSYVEVTVSEVAIRNVHKCLSETLPVPR